MKKYEQFIKYFNLGILLTFLTFVLFGQFLFRPFGWYRKLACKIGWHSYPMSEKLKPWHCYDRYVEAYIFGRTFKLSRFLLNPTSEWHVDNINRNLLDNRKSNLRLCSRCQNQWNRKVNKDNKIGKKGIQLMPNGKFRVRIQFNNKRFHLGVYDKLSEAIEAREKKEKALTWHTFYY